MRVLVNGVRLFVEVVGPKLVPAGARMVERPTLILLHGGPGADHSIYRPQMDTLADVAQLVYVDHRGNGRSEGRDPAEWNLAQWGDDVRGLADALGIERPIVFGASFGGMVALSYAVRHPDHARALILASTGCRGGVHTQRRVDLFGQLGGAAAGALAHRRLIEGDTSLEVIRLWRELCVPQYSNLPDPPEVAARMLSRPEVTQWFSRADGELSSFDLRPGMAAIACPVLLMGGERDPMLPVENLHDIAAALPNAQLQTEVFAGCRHMLARDDPQRFFALLRGFLGRHGGAADNPPA